MASSSVSETETFDALALRSSFIVEVARAAGSLLLYDDDSIGYGEHGALDVNGFARVRSLIFRLDIVANQLSHAVHAPRGTF